MQVKALNIGALGYMTSMLRNRNSKLIDDNNQYLYLNVHSEIVPYLVQNPEFIKELHKVGYNAIPLAERKIN